MIDFSTALLCVEGALWFVACVGEFRLLHKADEPRWKAFVPFFNDYALYKISWEKYGFFWVSFLCSTIGLFLCRRDSNFFGVVFIIVGFVVYFVRNLKLARAFGKDWRFAVGLAFLPFVFLPLLGFSDARYRGLQE